MNANACDPQGLSPLMTACKEGNIDIVNSLLHANAYVNFNDRNGDTSLIHAAKSGFVRIVESLIKAHADVDHQGNVSDLNSLVLSNCHSDSSLYLKQDKKTALYNAVDKGHNDAVRAILKANPNVELATKVWFKESEVSRN